MAWGRIKKLKLDQSEQYGYIKDDKGEGVYFDIADIVGIDELDSAKLDGLVDAVVHFRQEDKDWGKQARQIIIAE